MTLEEIAALEIKDVFQLLLSRIIQIPADLDGPIFMLDQDESKDFYDRVIMNTDLVKPSKELFDDELAEYKAELSAVEQARLDEVARVEDIKSRWGAIEDIRGAIAEAGIDVPNPAIEIKRIIEENDQAQLSLLESKGADAKVKADLQKSREERKELGKKKRRACEGALDVIAGYVDQSELDDAQIAQLESDFSQIAQMLRANYAATVKPLIEALSPDGVLVTQELKDDILEELKGF